MKKGNFAILILILFIVYWLTRPMKRDLKNWDKLKQLKPWVRENFILLFDDIRKMGLEPIITSAGRSKDAQDAAHRKDSRNPPGGNTSHETGIAVDLVLKTRSGQLINSKSSPATWLNSGVPQLAKEKYGMRWGGDFRNYFDPIHFDYLKL